MNVIIIIIIIESNVYLSRLPSYVHLLMAVHADTYKLCSNLNSIFTLDLDMALAYWNIVMKGRFKFLDLWCTFLQVCNYIVV